MHRPPTVRRFAGQVGSRSRLAFGQHPTTTTTDTPTPAPVTDWPVDGYVDCEKATCLEAKEKDVFGLATIMAPVCQLESSSQALNETKN